MKRLRISILGFGVVGQGLVELLAHKQDWLRQQLDLEAVVVSVASGRHGFVYREEGLVLPTLLELAAAKQPLALHPASRHWVQPLVGLQETGADVLVEATGTNLQDGEPGLGHIRTALTMGMHVITANKGPMALAASELQALARQHSVQLRAESTVMAGTPVLSLAQEGLAGASVQAVRGILNGTTNYILSAMAEGRRYVDVLAEAQAQGYAEADPTADVEGYDAVAKVLILSALVFGQPLTLEQVTRRGITTITLKDVEQARLEGKQIKLLATIERKGDALEARVEPVALPLTDPLAHVHGVMNAITLHTDTLSSVTVSGPGAGRIQTGQGLFADLVAIARTLA